MKKNLIKLKKLMEERLPRSEIKYSEMLFESNAKRAILIIAQEEGDIIRLNDNPDLFQRLVALSLCYFVSINRVDYNSSFGMVESYYRSYCLFENADLLDIASNRESLFYDSSKEALLGIVLALYDNKTETSAENLIDELI